MSSCENRDVYFKQNPDIDLNTSCIKYLTLVQIFIYYQLHTSTLWGPIKMKNEYFHTTITRYICNLNTHLFEYDGEIWRDGCLSIVFACFDLMFSFVTSQSRSFLTFRFCSCHTHTDIIHLLPVSVFAALVCKRYICIMCVLESMLQTQELVYWYEIEGICGICVCVCILVYVSVC